ncbi:immunoglobulin lambda-1 light chain-like [Limanda limanda]|uniref:immunoglobulin lambda-1 light chain-like n=1 Tax=Limanda limanda TaxID=27771 RepID=UPI0029C8233F|nr:immunoglobulin lambda-1 light chain-like [Limanda limanda]
MLLLPAAALCCLCSALVAMAAEPTQDQLSLTRRVDEQASFSCGGTDQCGWIYWFQKKDTGTFRLILLIGGSDVNIYKSYNHPQKDDFTAEIKQNSCELKIEKVKRSHAATYYCACWEVDYFIFGSGTKLFVDDRPLVTPVVSVYPAASIAALDGKSSLLCVASNMVPPLVQFSWTRQREGGPLETLSSADGEQLELSGTGRTAAIMVVDRHASYTYNYTCSVRHEGGTVEAPAEQEVSAGHTQTSPAAWTWSQRQVKLLCLLYTLLMVKSLVYCGGLALIHILRNRERPAAAHQTTEFPAAASTSH